MLCDYGKALIGFFSPFGLNRFSICPGVEIDVSQFIPEMGIFFLDC
jgi:hypothetical protein